MNMKILKKLAAVCTVCLMAACGGKEETIPVIMIDPGHDMNYPGETGLVTENEYTAALGAAVAANLQEKGGAEVLLTHEAEQNMAAEKRLTLIAEKQPAAVISLHARAGTWDDGGRIRIALPKPGTEIYADSLRLAQAFAEQFADRTVEIGTYYYIPTRPNAYAMEFHDQSETEALEYETLVLPQSCTSPVIVVEMLNVNNSDDVNALAGEEGISASAEKITAAVRKYTGSAD